MASYVQIANLAGELIGTDARLTNPDDDRPLARNVKAVWDLQRRATIRDGEWNFASKRDALAALSDPGIIYPFGYAYRPPAASLRLLEVLNLSERESYSLEGGLILCDSAGPLYVRYLVDVTEPALWDDMFAHAFAARIAVTIGRRIAGSAYDMDAGWRVYRQALADAKGTDGRENPPLEPEESSWILARVGGPA